MTANARRYPKDGVIFPRKGIRLSGNLFEVSPDFSVILQNLYWVNDSLLQRKPFTRHSTEDFSAEGVFKGAHEYITPGGTSRLLFLTNSGKLKEWVSASSHTDRIASGIGTGNDGDFANFLDACAFVNNSSAPRVGRDTSWRQLGSPAALSTFSVSPSGSGSFTGDFLHIVVPVIEVSGVGVVFGDWPIIVKTSPSSNGQFDVTWTDVVDSRITHYYYFRTRVGATVFESVAKIAAGVGSYTDTTLDTALPVTVSGVPRFAPIQYSWGVPPVSKYVVFCGNRLAYLNLSGEENAFQLSRVGDTSYDVEGVPSNGSTKIFCLREGPITGGFPIGETGEGSPRANHLFVAQKNACYYLPETDPLQKLQIISGHVGCINKHAIAQFNNHLFFQSERGVEFWPGPGHDLYLVSENIRAVFEGGGVENLTANTSDTSIRYEVWRDHLLITVQDDNTRVQANKVYILDLQHFKKSFDPLNPKRAARFSGPWVNSTLGFSIPLKLRDGTLLMFDNQNVEILKWDESATQDYIGGTDTDIPVKIKGGPLLKEDPIAGKTVLYAHCMAFSNSNLSFRLDGEFSRTIYTGTLEANTYGFSWSGITWTGITWNYDTWYSEASLPFLTVSTKWVVPTIEKQDSSTEFAFFGLALWYHAWKQIRTFR